MGRNKFEKSSYNLLMRHLKHISNVVGITLVIVLVFILIHDIHPLVIDTHGKDKSVPVSTESSTTDHSDGCNASCPCVNHVLENASNQCQIQTNILYPCSSIWVGQEQKPKSVIIKPIDHPPEA